MIRSRSIYEPPRPALIVDDDPELLAAMLNCVRAQLRCEPLGASDYSAALLHLERAKPVVACIDLTLPRESGYELCEHIRLRSTCSDIPILVTGETAFPGDMANAEEAGANLFLEKPFSMSALAIHISTLIEKPRVSRGGLRFLRLF